MDWCLLLIECQSDFIDGVRCVMIWDDCRRRSCLPNSKVFEWTATKWLTTFWPDSSHRSSNATDYLRRHGTNCQVHHTAYFWARGAVSCHIELIRQHSLLLWLYAVSRRFESNSRSSTERQSIAAKTCLHDRQVKRVLERETTSKLCLWRSKLCVCLITARPQLWASLIIVIVIIIIIRKVLLEQCATSRKSQNDLSGGIMFDGTSLAYVWAIASNSFERIAIWMKCEIYKHTWNASDSNSLSRDWHIPQPEQTLVQPHLYSSSLKEIDKVPRRRRKANLSAVWRLIKYSVVTGIVSSKSNWIFVSQYIDII